MARKSGSAVVTTTRGRGPDGRYISVPVTPNACQPVKHTEPLVKRTADTNALPPVGPTAVSPVAKLKNHIALVIDESTSMSSLRLQMVSTINSFIELIRKNAAEADQETTISLTVFASSVRHPYIAADAKNLQNITYGEYKPDGMTALLDGVGCTIEKLRALPDAHDPNTSFLILPITDGDENYSTRYKGRRLTDLLAELEKDGRWTVAFQVPQGTRAHFCRAYSIPVENVREWETNAWGLDATGTATSQGVTGFFDARKTGAKKVEKFFFTDLSKVTDRQIQTKLIDMKKQYKLLLVDKESPIKEFVELKTGKPYVLGSAFYELTKPETVQPQKDVLILKRGDERGAIYGGSAARDVLGLPQGEHAKVTVANLGQWRPLIKSTSPNRKLVRGTYLAIDLHKVMPDSAHFDTTVLDPKT